MFISVLIIDCRFTDSQTLSGVAPSLSKDWHSSSSFCNLLILFISYSMISLSCMLSISVRSTEASMNCVVGDLPLYGLLSLKLYGSP